jgi:hypothetical protein
MSTINQTQQVDTTKRIDDQWIFWNQRRINKVMIIGYEFEE